MTAVLRRDSVGPEVEALQRDLVVLGFGVVVDGSFGRQTEAAVRQFQAAHGLAVDGVVGSRTRASLREAVGEAPSDPSLRPDQPSDLAGRVLRVMDLLVERYRYSPTAAAGIVGNLRGESDVQPERLEGSSTSSPLTARDFGGQRRTFTPEAVRDRDKQARKGPRLAGVGIAQWTFPPRRKGLFAHDFAGRTPGAQILFDLDAQVDYLVTELRKDFGGVHAELTRAGVSLVEATDVFLEDFERPAHLAGTRPRRREFAAEALQAYAAAHPPTP